MSSPEIKLGWDGTPVCLRAVCTRSIKLFRRQVGEWAFVREHFNVGSSSGLGQSHVKVKRGVAGCARPAGKRRSLTL